MLGPLVLHVRALWTIHRALSFYSRYPERWLRVGWKNGDKCCLEQFFIYRGMQEVLRKPTLQAAWEITGKRYPTIPGFNDGRETTYAMFLAVLRRTRANMLLGLVPAGLRALFMQKSARVMIEIDRSRTSHRVRSRYG